jgi:hypothetical protein
VLVYTWGTKTPQKSGSKANNEVIYWTCHNDQVFLEKKQVFLQNTTFPEPDVVSNEYEEDVTGPLP